jgi:hypothetical protein
MDIIIIIVILFSFEETYYSVTRFIHSKFFG